MAPDITSRKDRRRTLRAIDAVYAGLPTLACKGKCQECCGPVMMSDPEWGRIVERLVVEPRRDESLTCPMLCKESGRCMVYDIRPLICRIWGMVKSMACPHGCRPSRWLTDKEAREIIARVEAIARR